MSEKTDKIFTPSHVTVKLSLFPNKKYCGLSDKDFKSLINGKVIQAYPKFLNSNIQNCKIEAPPKFSDWDPTYFNI